MNCKWTWIGDDWDQDDSRSCPPGQTCDPPGFPGSYTGQVELTPCH